MPRMSDANRGSPVATISALGLTQIIGYGTLYYSFSILAPGMAKDLGISLERVFGVFSASLFVGGLCAPIIGKQMDRIGAATVLTLGSILSALTLALCAWSPSIVVFALAVVLIEVASGMIQYQAAFAALVESDPKTASRSITYLTLIGGFASTIFWPVSAALLGYLTWREIYVAFAAVERHLLAGSLRSLVWCINYETEQFGLSRYPRSLSKARRIATEWARLEGEHGEDCMLVAEDPIIQRVAANPDSRLGRRPELVEGANSLRAIKGEDWWREMHQIQSYS